MEEQWSLTMVVVNCKVARVGKKESHMNQNLRTQMNQMMNTCSNVLKISFSASWRI